jgi:hypothetical protein
MDSWVSRHMMAAMSVSCKEAIHTWGTCSSRRTLHRAQWRNLASAGTPLLLHDAPDLLLLLSCKQKYFSGCSTPFSLHDLLHQPLASAALHSSACLAAGGAAAAPASNVLQLSNPITPSTLLNQ